MEHLFLLFKKRNITKWGNQLMLQVYLTSVGNPDYNQDPNKCLPNAPSLFKPVDSIQAASKVCLEYISEFELGSGNWKGGQVYKDNMQIAYISYNGRIWWGNKEF